MLKDYGNVDSKGSVRLNERSPFVVVTDNNGKEMVVRKTSVCWLLPKEKFKLSSDRLQRVQEKDYTNTSSKYIFQN